MDWTTGISPVSATQHDESRLLELARRGDPCAFELLIAPHLKRLFNIVIGITRDRSDGEDVVQDAVLKAYTRLHQFKGTARFSTWFVKIGVNQALMCLRTRHSKGIALGVSEDGASPPMDVQDIRPDPETQHRESELKELLHRRINELPCGLRDVCRMRYIDEVSVEMTAAILGLSIAATKSRSFRAQRRIAEMFEADARKCQRRAGS
jgi:RNA polymerase sigma-70 factor, ECF subfamily